MNRGEFLKQKVLNMIDFLQPYIDIDKERVASLSPFAIWGLMEAHLNQEAAEDKDIDNLLGGHPLSAEVGKAYPLLDEAARVKFWRYIDCFRDCINSN